jgi:hypothetical protein
VWYWHKHRHIAQWNITETLDVNSCIYNWLSTKVLKIHIGERPVFQ